MEMQAQVENRGAISHAKQRVLDAAEELFMRRGYNAITLRDIAAELGMRQASLYYHFPDGKEQLYAEMVEQVLQRYHDGMMAAIDSAGPDVAAQLQAIASWFVSQPPINLSSMMHADMPALSAGRAEHLAQVAYRCMFSPLRKVFIEGNARGETRYVNPNVLAGSFLAIMDGMAFSGDPPAAPARTEMIDDIVSVLLNGLRMVRPAALAGDGTGLPSSESAGRAAQAAGL